MKLRVAVLRFRTKSGSTVTKYYIEYFGFSYGWDFLYHHGLVSFRKRADAEEYIRLYNSIKKHKRL